MVGVLPDSGFPHVDGKATRNSQRTTRTQCNHDHLLQHMHSITVVVSVVIPLKRANGTILVRCKVEELDVFGTFVAEVVVHGDGSCTRVFGHGSSRTMFS